MKHLLSIAPAAFALVVFVFMAAQLAALVEAVTL